MLVIRLENWFLSRLLSRTQYISLETDNFGACSMC